MLVAVINPVCGDSTAALFFRDQVFPVIRPDKTLYDQDYSSIGDIVLLGSGDGTLHEIINALRRPLRFVIVPCGTANALYASLFRSDDRLRSVRAYLDNAVPRPLAIASTTIAADEPPVLSAVVVSTALHATILHHSEALRATHPGLDRFKIAAEQNAPTWYSASVTLLGDSVQIFEPATGSFVACPERTLNGPFVYFLSTVNVDRLEPTFRIAPLACDIPSTAATCDIIVIRPRRHPNQAVTNPDFVSTTWKTLSGAYAEGAHVRFTYEPDGSIVDNGSGPTVVEYFRCQGWEWTPDPQDKDAHLLCTDGTIFHIPEHGRATTSIRQDHPFSVYV